ncbi:uncharacterized protein LOC142322703 [Lycorma delicatula]|uniref:uncharacterized protein LOC142322703 n=1 Tax=Lycorma delicatula TaxID=130591 RepID=UPI003F510359
MTLEEQRFHTKHIQYVVEKAERSAAALGRIMPWYGASRTSRRRLVISATVSIVLYAAPAQGCAAYNNGVQDGFRGEAVRVLAGLAPVRLLIEERDPRRRGLAPGEARQQLSAAWQEQWDTSKKGRRT